MVVVKDCFTALEIPMADVTGEVCWVKIDTKDNPLYVGSFCRSPADNSPKQLLELEKSLEEISQLTKNDPSATVIVGGDL